MAALVVLSGCGTDEAPARTTAPSSDDLVARWWTWAAVPEATNPVSDPNGAQCARRQPKDVWFLAGNFGGVTKRSCSLPSGVDVFGPVGNTVCLVADESVVSALDRCAMDYETLKVTLDGKPVEVTERHSVGAFPLDLTEHNPLFDVPAGRYSAVGRGTWFGPMKLADGSHEMQIQARSGQWGLDVTYDLKVGP